MPAGLDILRHIPKVRETVTAWRREGLAVGLVPTMGALHEGHFSLIRRSVAENDRTVVTLFVNPRQFGPNEDLATYPRDEAQDAAAVARLGADILFAPGSEEMYPAGAVTAVSVPGIGDILEGAFRPGFFTGVATIVTKLFLQAPATRAYFGEKDYQQLCVIRRMVNDLDIPIDIVPCPTVRERDGLAISSRNAYLDAAERAIAPALSRVLKDTAGAWNEGIDREELEADGADHLLAAGFTKVDYVAIRRPGNLDLPAPGERPARVLGAAFVGRTRLIDNIAVG